jgi:glycerol kinase
MRTKEIITAMQKDADITFKSLKVDGGGSTNNLLMQIQSNLLGVEVIRPETTETTALGAAFFAGLASGYWPSVESLSDIWKIDKQFSPLENEETQKIVSKWNERISKTSNSKVHE